MTTALLTAHAPILAKSGITLDPIAKPLAAVLAFFYSIVPNYGIAIFLLTVAMMIVLTPLSIKQTRSMLVMQKLQPQLKRLQETHKNDRQALNEAVMALYKEHGASPLGGCLPMLLPLPVFIALLKVLEGLSRLVKGQSAPKYLSKNTQMYMDIVHAKGQLDAFGMNLAKSARTINGSFGTKLPYFVLLLLMVGTQYYQQAQLTSRNPQASSQPGQAAMMKFIPLFFGLISIQFPAGVVIYWTVSNMIRILSQTLMYRYDPKVKALVAQDIKEVEAKTREIGADAAENPSTRPRFRDLLKGTASGLAGKDGGGNDQGGKGAARPGGRSGSAAPGGRNGSGKPGPGTSGTTKPGTTRSGATKPGASRPGTPGKPGAVKPGAVKPEGVKPGTGKPGAVKPGGVKPGTGKPGSVKPGGVKPGAVKPGSAKPGTGSGTGSAKTGGGSVPTRGADSGSAKPGSSTPSGSGAPKPASGGNGAGKPTTPAKPAAASAKPVDAGTTGTNGKAGADGAAASTDGPAKGRTGAGSARSVSRHRRARKGR